MANSTGVSVAQSSVYRGIYIKELRNSAYQHSIQQQPQHVASTASVDSQKWTFLQKLLAIEEAHDRKKEARERERNCKATTGSIKVSKKSSYDDFAPQHDSLSRWLHSQVLDDGPEDSQASGTYDKNEQRNFEESRLPQLHSTTSNPPTEQDERGMASSHRSSIPNLPAISESSSYSQVRGDGLSRLKSSDQHDVSSDLHGPTNSERMPDSMASNQDEGKVTNCSRPKRKRQLRLPPILLPRVYTITPRPLQYREFLTPTKIRGPITDDEWEELKDCRYIRQAVPRFALDVSSSNMSLQY